jgi:O-antigen ligase
MIPTVMIVTVFSGVVAALLIAKAAVIFEVLGRDVTFTGRIPLWLASWNDVLQRPWLGYGYRAYWLGPDSPSQVIWYTDDGRYTYPSHGHNAFLDLTLELGFVGLTVFAMFLYRCCYQTYQYIREGKDGLWRWYPLVLVYVLASGIPGGEVFAQNSIAWVLLVSVYAYTNRAKSPDKRFESTKGAVSDSMEMATI